MKRILISIFAIVVCIVATSGCLTTKPNATFMQAECVVETQEPDVIFEVKLDGKLIFSGKTCPVKNKGNLGFCKFTTWLGDHRLAVTATGHEGWYQEIGLVDGSKFWAKLKTK